jgi:dihydropteroate synthase
MNGAVLQLRDIRLTLRPGAPLVMGVVNASPESFSDGAEAATLDRQLARAQALVDAGASIIRVHDVAEVIDFLTVRRALRGEVDIPADLHLAEALRREPTGPSSSTIYDKYFLTSIVEHSIVKKQLF